MKKPVKIVLLIIAGLIFIALMVTLVWGRSIRMASANQLFLAKDLTNQTKAEKIYEDMAVDEPNSPYMLHNLGLGQYKQGKFDQAASCWQKALKAFEGVKLSPEFVKTILHRFQYHFGNALFKLAVLSEKNQSNPSGQSIQSGQSGQDPQQQTTFMYQTALDSYRQAIEANPDDLDAKYNYELTRLRLEQEQSKQNQQSQDQKDQQGQKDQNGQQSGSQQNQQNQNQQQQGSQSQSGAEQKQGQMSKAEAEALLKMAERGDQYQGPVISGAESPTTKDW